MFNAIQSFYNVKLYVLDNSNQAFKTKTKPYDLSIRQVKNTLLSRLTYFLKGIYFFNKQIKINKYDIVIYHLKKLNFMSVFLSKHKKINVIHSRINFQNPIEYIMYKLVFKRSEKVIFVSYGLKEEFCRKLKIPINSKKLMVLYNFTNLPNHFVVDLKAKKDILVSIGRLEEKKGFQHVLRSLNKIRNQLADFKYYIIGEGSYRDELEKLIKQYYLEDQVKLIGYVENPEKYLEKAKVFILSSYYETFSLAMIEAMSYGLAIISSNCKHGPREILSYNQSLDNKHYVLSKYGIIVPNLSKSQLKQKLSQSEEELAQAIYLIIHNTNLREKLAHKAFKRAKIYSKHRFLEEFKKIFDESEI